MVNTYGYVHVCGTGCPNDGETVLLSPIRLSGGAYTPPISPYCETTDQPLSSLTQIEVGIAIQGRIDAGCPNCGRPWSGDDIAMDLPRLGTACGACQSGQ